MPREAKSAKTGKFFYLRSRLPRVIDSYQGPASRTADRVVIWILNMDLLGLFSFRKDTDFINSNSPNPKAYGDVIERLGDIRSLTAKDRMVPRALVQAVDMDVEIGRLHFWKIAKSQYFPVYTGDLDHILGWISKDALHSLIHDGRSGTLNTEDVHVPAEHISEDMPLDQVFLKFVQQSAPLFVVQDQAGVTTGVLYLNDVLEQFFGLDIHPADDRGASPHAAHG